MDLDADRSSEKLRLASFRRTVSKFRDPYPFNRSKMLRRNVMNKHKFFAVAALALALFLSALQLNGNALASHPVQEITFRYRLLNTVDPGSPWTNPQGLHIRNRVDIGTLSGGIAGTARVVYNADFAPAGSAGPTL